MSILKLIVWLVLAVVIAIFGVAVITQIANAVIDKKTPVRLPIGPTVNVRGWEDGYISAVGTFVLDNDRQAFPFQVSRVECYREEMACIAARAQVAFFKFLDVELDRYKINLWNTTTLQLRVIGQCVEQIYTIDRTSQRMIGRRTKRPNADGCEAFQEKPLSITLANGHEVWTKIRKEAEASTLPWMWGSIIVWLISVVFFGWRWRPRA